MMLTSMIDLIRLSTTDHLWVTIALIAMRFVTLCVVATWAGAMMLGQLRSARRPSWPLSWPWSLLGWMFAIVVQIIISASRVLTVENVREQNTIGEVYRAFEIAAAVNLGFWSIVAFWRWAHPIPPVSDEGVFATLASSMPLIVADDRSVIVYATPPFEALAGYPNDGLIGKNLMTIIPERLRDAHESGLRRFLATGESQIIGQVVSLDLLRKDGTELPIYLAVVSADVGGQPWFCGSVWKRTGVVERQQVERSVQQDEQQVVLDSRQIEMNDEQTAMDERQIEQDDRGKEQDDRNEAQAKRDVTIGDVIQQTSNDVSIVKSDIQVIKKKIIDEEAP